LVVEVGNSCLHLGREAFRQARRRDYFFEDKELSLGETTGVGLAAEFPCFGKIAALG